LLRHCDLKDLSQVGKVQLKMAVAENFQFSHQRAYLHCELALQKKVRSFFFLKLKFTQRKFQIRLVRPKFLESFWLFAPVDTHSTLVFLRSKLQQWKRETVRNSELDLHDGQAILT